MKLDSPFGRIFLSTLFAVFICMNTNLQAQTTDQAIAKAYYTFYHVTDTTKRDAPSKMDMVLYLGTKASLYRMVIDEESKLLLHISKGGTPENFDLIEESASQVFINGKSYDAERIIDSKYLIIEEAPVIAWILEDEVKEIHGYLAQKATADYGGRSYTAWFSPDLPFSFGPWQLVGLPGLILEAEDSKSEVRFEFAGFQTENIDPVLGKITFPKSFKFKKVTRRDFDKIYRGFLANKIGFIRASLGLEPDSKAVIKNVDQDNIDPYNPLILLK